MAKALTIEINETQAVKLESLIDETLAALQNLEENSWARDARIEESQKRTATIMDETEARLALISELNQNRKTFSTIFS